MTKSYYPQIFATLSGALATFTTGQLIGWVSPSIPFLESENSIFPGGITSSESSWVVILSMMGNILATLFVACFADILGRKPMILFTTLPIFLSWIMIYLTNSIEILYAARFIGGIGDTIGKATMFMYIGEIAQPAIRGALGTILVYTLNSGILFEYALGPFLSFRNLALISAFIPILLFVTFVFMPESPYFLLMHGHVNQAEKSLKRLRLTKDVSDELSEIKSFVESKLPKLDALKLLLTVKKNRNTLILMCVLFASQELSGITPNIMYAEKILKETKISFMRTELIPVILPIVKIASTLLTTVLVDKIGRRPLFILSTLLCGLSLTFVSIYFYLLEVGKYDMTEYSWIPIVTITIYNFAFIFGFGCLPFIIIGELFPTNIKSVAISITSLCSPVIAVIVTKIFQILVETYGRYASFGFFAISCYICFIFILLCLPETKNKTLAQIVQSKIYACNT